MVAALHAVALSRHRNRARQAPRHETQRFARRRASRRPRRFLRRRRALDSFVSRDPVAARRVIQRDDELDRRIERRCLDLRFNLLNLLGVEAVRVQKMKHAFRALQRRRERLLSERREAKKKRRKS